MRDNILDIGHCFNSGRRIGKYCGSVFSPLAPLMASYLREAFPETAEAAEATSAPKTFWSRMKHIPPYEYITDEEIPFQINGRYVTTNYAITKDIKSEIFYALRLTLYYTELPMRIQYFIKAHEDQFPGQMAIFPFTAPEDVIAEIAAEGCLKENATFKDVVSALIGYPVEFLSEERPVVWLKDGSGIAKVEGGSMPVRMPRVLVEKLSIGNLKSLKLVGNYVCLNDFPIHKLLDGVRGYYLSGDSYNLCDIL